MKKCKNLNNNVLNLRSLLYFICNTIVIIFSLAFIFYSNINAQECNAKKVDKEKTATELLKDYSYKGNLEKIKELIDKDNDLVNARLGQEETALTIAAYNGNYDVAEYLIGKKANIDCRNDWNNNALINAAMQGEVNIARLLLAKGAKIDARGYDGYTALHYAVQEGRTEMVKFLIQNKCKVDNENDYGHTPLIMASWKGKPEIIKILVENGANINFINPYKNTSLHYLASGGYTESVNILINAGANANISDNDNCLPLQRAVNNGKAEVVKVLIEKTDNLNQKEIHTGNTPMHMAAINGDLKTFRLLVDAQADYNILNNQNQKPIDYAIKYGYTDLISYCIQKNLATPNMLKQAEDNRKAWNKKTETGNARVFYCGHSGWAVNTKNSVLIFDYWSRNKLSEKPSLSNGTIFPEELKDKKVIVFVSHDHTDHYDTIIYSWKKEIKDITYVYGFRPENSWMHKKAGYKGPDYVYVDDNKSAKIGNAKVTTIKSNDTGQGFLVEVDGVSVYHPGDHALFTPEDEEGFKKEIDFLATQNSAIDIAFLPVTGCPSRWKKEYIVNGFFYNIEKLNPKQVYPMHAFQREYTLKEFADMAKERKSKAGIMCVENIGDNSIYNNKNLAGN